MNNNKLRAPTIYITGTQKGGSTSLHFLLQSHKDVYFPPTPQELHYFDIEKNYNKGPSWFLSHFQDAPADSILAQTSPLYMYLKKVPNRIAEFNKESRFIFILRNPIDRAYSHYWNSVKYGFERLSFEEALKKESERIEIDDEHRRNFSYVDRGFYTEQIQRYIDLFGENSVLLLTQDQLKISREAVQKSLCRFLDIDTEGFNQSYRKSIHNPAKLPRFNSLQTLRPSLEKRNFRIAVRLLDRTNLVVKQYPPMQTQTRQMLQKVFHDELEQFSKLISNSVDYQAQWR